MNKLWFPVKLGPFALNVSCPRAFAVALFACHFGCGYHAAYGGSRPAARLSVVAAPPRAPDAGALAGVLAGVRAELSRAGVLGSGDGYPRVVVELVRVDERGTAQTLTTETANGQRLPQASGALIGVTARAWVESSASEVDRDTGDLRRTAAFGAQSDPSSDANQRESALRMAGQAAGEALGRRIMGEVDVAQEPM